MSLTANSSRFRLPHSIWDAASVQQRCVIKPTLSKPGRIHVTSCAYSSDGTLIAGGLMDGTLQVSCASIQLLYG